MLPTRSLFLIQFLAVDSLALTTECIWHLT